MNKLNKTILAHDDIITDIKEINNGLLISSSADKSIKLWNLNETENVLIKIMNGNCPDFVQKFFII